MVVAAAVTVVAWWWYNLFVRLQQQQHHHCKNVNCHEFRILHFTFCTSLHWIHLHSCIQQQQKTFGFGMCIHQTIFVCLKSILKFELLSIPLSFFLFLCVSSLCLSLSLEKFSIRIFQITKFCELQTKRTVAKEFLVPKNSYITHSMMTMTMTKTGIESHRTFNLIHIWLTKMLVFLFFECKRWSLASGNDGNTLTAQAYNRAIHLMFHLPWMKIHQ